MNPVQNPPRERRRRGAILLLGIGAFGLAAASAASLGGLTSSSLGADNGAVSSCDSNGVTIAYGAPAYDGTAGLYKISTVTVGGIDAACAGKTVAVTLSDTLRTRPSVRARPSSPVPRRRSR
ncbi:MAG: hypothetical protein JJE46_07450 [Acidimicrobiia bacterium]|nr:hypothetical protein [Acidimicrobiia bacterium]